MSTGSNYPQNLMPAGNGDHPYKQPSGAATFVVTWLFGLFGLIPLFLHTGEARDRGLDTRRYFIAFALGLLASAALWASIVIMVL